MALFQPSVLKKYLQLQDSNQLTTAYSKFCRYFHNKEIQHNIRNSKEEQFQEGFLNELFVKVFGYTLNPKPKFNLTTEFKNQKGSKKADGAILSNDKALAVIELKSTKTKDLESIRQQAFDYKANQSECVYVITSNFEKLRFYINNAVDYEEFNLFTLNEEDFALLYLCLHKDNLLSNLPLRIKTESVVEEEKITKKFYKDYSLFKRELYRDLVKENMKNQVFRDELQNGDSDRATKNIKLTLFKKSQKLIDRFLFIFFAEDRGLLPPNSVVEILKQWEKLIDLDEEIPLYNRYKKYFQYLDIGRKGTNKKAEIFAYNGGLFQEDKILDSLIIDNKLLYQHTKALSAYDFESQVDVNILGHIFENSLNEIESINAEIEGGEFDKQKTKRKKDGVFYTPKYITKYIVDNTVGKLCKEKKEKLGITSIDFEKNYLLKTPRSFDVEVEIQTGKGTKLVVEKKKTNISLEGSKHLKTLDQYRDYLLGLSILDPACGSGAFLNQAIDFLIKEHKYIDEMQANIQQKPMALQDIENTILEKNIYGVDINEESVEIAKLSLWLRTAQPRRKLTSLNNNIKCGNSLIDSKAVAGNKAFNWQKEFPTIFQEKKKNIYHITTATHDSRTSQRMIDYQVRLKRDGGSRPKAEGIWLEADDELLVTKSIAEVVKTDNINVLAYNICGDHMHLLLACEEDELTKTVGKLKAISAKEYNTAKGITTREHVPATAKNTSEVSSETRGHVPLHREKKKTYNSLWTQKFHCKPIENDEQLHNTIEYIQNNRSKHELPKHKKELNSYIKEICCTHAKAMQTDYKGGFDVVIGNPPYVQSRSISEAEKEFIYKFYKTAEYQINTYGIFVEKSIQLLKTKSYYSLIIPNYWLSTKYDASLRKEVFLTNHALELINTYEIFEDATVDTLILTGKKDTKSEQITSFLSISKSLRTISERLEAINLRIWDYSEVKHFKNGDEENTISFNKELKLKGNHVLGEYFSMFQGMKPYEKGKGKPQQTREMMNEKIYHSKNKINESYFPLIGAKHIQRNYLIPFSEYIKYGQNLAAPRKKEIFIGERILVNRILSKKNIDGIILSDTYINNTDVFNLIPNKTNAVKTKVLYALIVSRLCATYFKKNNINLNRNAFPKINVNTLEKFPVPQISNENQLKIEILVDSILEKTKNYRLKIFAFTTYLHSQFNFESLSKKLQNWHTLEFGEFIKEVNKAIKKENKVREQNREEIDKGTCPLGTDSHDVKLIPALSKLDEMAWMEVFEAKKAEAVQLQEQINKTDKEIDQMVYELYSLSEEEIKIVESC